MENHSTFTNGIITFEYPDVFEKIASPEEDIVSGSSNWQEIGNFSFEGRIDIQIAKNSHAKSPITARDDTETGVLMISNGQILTHSTVKNSHGILAQKSIHSLMDPRSKMEIIYNSIFFRARGVVYSINVLGLDLDYELIDITANTVFETLIKNDLKL